MGGGVPRVKVIVQALGLVGSTAFGLDSGAVGATGFWPIW